MLADKFDAYGEVLPDGSRGKRKAGTASTAISRVGQYAFWLVVVAIVAARVLLYPAAPSFDVGSAAATKQSVTR
jgi:hypothetical protein